MRIPRPSLLWAAFTLSVFIHLAVTLSDTVWRLWQHQSLEDVITQPTRRTLQAQTLAAVEHDAKAALAGIEPTKILILRLASPRAPAAQAPPKPALLKKPPRKLPAPKPVESPVPELVTPQAPELAQALPLLDTMPKRTAEPALPVDAPAEDRPVLSAVFPQQVKIGYVVRGLVTAGHEWRLTGNRYDITTQGSFMGKAVAWHSEGEIDRHGLRPIRFREYRNNLPEPKYQVDFDWEAGKVRFGEPGQQKEADLQAGAQDAFSAAYQFALQGSSLPSFSMQVVTGRNSYQLPFELKGEAQLMLSGETVNTLVLQGVSQKRRFTFYLAPEWHNLPMRITFDDDGKQTDLNAISLQIDGEVRLSEQVENIDR